MFLYILIFLPDFSPFFHDIFLINSIFFYLLKFIPIFRPFYGVSGSIFSIFLCTLEILEYFSSKKSKKSIIIFFLSTQYKGKISIFHTMMKKTQPNSLSNVSLIDFLQKNPNLPSSEKILITRNKEILSFFENNPETNFEDFLVGIVRLFNNFSLEMKNKLTTNIHNQILTSVQNIDKSTQQFPSSINQMKQELLDQLRQDQQGNMNSLKSSYLQDLRDIVKTLSDQQNNIILSNVSQLENKIIDHKEVINTNFSQLQNTLINQPTFLENMVDKLIDKKFNELRALFPTQTEHFKNVLDKELQNLKDYTLSQLQTLKPNNNEDVSALLNHSEDKIQTFMLTLSKNAEQSVINNFKNVSDSFEKRIQYNISDFKDEQHGLRENILSMKKISEKGEKFYDRQMKSSDKGIDGETNLEHLLNSWFKDAEIGNTSNISSSGDFILRRENKPTVLIETKDYDKNVPVKEVRKFITDIKTQKCHGLFLSHNSGIASKEPWTIEQIDSCIVVYLHNVKYDRDIIECGVRIIDELSNALQQTANTQQDGIQISPKTLNTLKNELHEFMKERDILIGLAESTSNTLKELHKRISNLILPQISSTITGVFQCEIKHFQCDICNNASFETKMKLAAHKRHCIKKT